MAFAGTAWSANWRYMPHSLSNPLYECTKVQHPLWSMDYVPYDTWLYWAGYTKRPTEKKDFHIEAWNGTQYSVKMMYEKDDGSKQIYELCSGGTIQSVLPCLEAQCRPQRKWY